VPASSARCLTTTSFPIRRDMYLPRIIPTGIRHLGSRFLHPLAYPSSIAPKSIDILHLLRTQNPLMPPLATGRIPHKRLTGINIRLHALCSIDLGACGEPEEKRLD